MVQGLCPVSVAQPWRQLQVECRKVGVSAAMTAVIAEVKAHVKW